MKSFVVLSLLIVTVVAQFGHHQFDHELDHFDHGPEDHLPPPGFGPDFDFIPGFEHHGAGSLSGGNLGGASWGGGISSIASSSVQSQPLNQPDFGILAGGGGSSGGSAQSQNLNQGGIGGGYGLNQGGLGGLGGLGSFGGDSLSGVGGIGGAQSGTSKQRLFGGLGSQASASAQSSTNQIGFGVSSSKKVANSRTLGR